MAYDLEDNNVNINDIVKFFYNNGENCIRIMYGRTFVRTEVTNDDYLGKINNDIEKGYKLNESLIIEPLKEKDNINAYQSGHRTLSIDRRSKLIVVNPYIDRENTLKLKSFIENTISRNRQNKINKIL